MDKQNIKDMAEATILDIWSCIDWDKVDGRRAYGIWDEFGAKVKASAMSTNSYEKFVEKLCKKMDIRSLKYKSIKDIGEQPEEVKQAILKLIREETLQIILRVRLNQEKLKEDYNNKQVSFTKKGVKVNE